MKFIVLVVWASSLGMHHSYFPVETKYKCVQGFILLKKNSPKAIVSAKCFLAKEVK